MPVSRAAVEAEIHARFARAALGLYGESDQFEIAVPEGYDEVEITAAFRDLGCDITYITPQRSVIVAIHDRGAR